MAIVFFAYDARYRDQVEEVYAAFQQAAPEGLQPWMDSRDIPVGDPWDKATSKALDGCDFIVTFGTTIEDPRLIRSYNRIESSEVIANEILDAVSERRPTKMVTLHWQPEGASLFVGRRYLGESPQTVEEGSHYCIFGWNYEPLIGVAEGNARLELVPYQTSSLQDAHSLAMGAPVEEHLRKIQFLIKQRDENALSTAEGWWTTLARILPTWWGTWFLKALVFLYRHQRDPHQHRRNLDAARFNLKIATSYEPKAPLPLYFQAICHAREHRLDEVEHTLEQLLSPMLARNLLQQIPQDNYPLEDPHFDPIKDEQGKEILRQITEGLIEQAALGDSETLVETEPPSSLPLTLRGFHLDDFHGFDKAPLGELPGDAAWIFLTGDNAEGKTSLLQALAIAFYGIRGTSLLDAESRCRILVWLHGPEGPIIGDYDHQNKQGDDTRRRLDGLLGYGASRRIEDTEESYATRSLLQQGGLRSIEPWLKERWIQFLQDGNQKAKASFDQMCKLLTDVMPSVERIEVQDGKIAYFEGSQQLEREQLSAGNKAVLALLGDMLMHLDASQPGTPIADYQGIVLIDELETHLHPRTQHALPKLLSGYLPKVQFIASTHSPFPILGAPSDKVVIRVSKIDGKSEVEVIDGIEIDKLQPNSLMTSDIFGLNFQQISGQDPEPHPYDNYPDIEREKKREAFLKKVGDQRIIPDDYFNVEET